MDVILKDIIKNDNSILGNGARLKGLLRDVFPNDTRMVNILMIMNDSGMLNQISQCQVIDETQMWKFINCLETEYGFKEQYVYEGIKVWADIFDVNCANMVFEYSSEMIDCKDESVAIFGMNQIIFENDDLQIIYKGIQRNRLYCLYINKSEFKIHIQQMESEVNGNPITLLGAVALETKEKTIYDFMWDSDILKLSTDGKISNIKALEIRFCYECGCNPKMQSDVIKLQPYFL